MMNNRAVRAPAVDSPVRLSLRLLSLLAGYRRAVALAAACGLGYTLLSLLPPLVLRQVIRQLIDGSGSSIELAGLALLLALVAALRGWARFAEAITSHAVAYRVMHDLTVRAFAHLQRLPQSFFADRRSGELASRVVADAAEIEAFVAHGITQATQAILVPLAMIGVLIYLDWRLGLLALVPLPFAVWLMLGFFPRARDRWRAVRMQIGELSAAVQESIAGVTVVKAFRAEDARLAVVEKRSAAFRDDITNANYWSLVPNATMEVLAGLGAALVIWQGGLRAFGGGISAGDLFVFVFYVTQIYQPLLQLTLLNEGIQNALASAERVFTILDTQPGPADAPNARTPAQPCASVDFDGVVFGYDPARPVLRGLSFSVAEGETVALVGLTGAGKTTAANLVPRFYDVQGGAVRLGGEDVRNLPLAFVRGSVALVLQDVFLFHGTIRENLLLARPCATEEQIQAAARAANVDEFAERFPGGYETLVGERGVRLSGGQRQRISIARALLKDAPILVLDEATSSVDAETEGLIQEAITRLAASRTTIVIAHRMSTIRRADRIIVLDGGRALEVGTHDELVARGGLYAAMERAHAVARRWAVPSRSDSADAR